MAIVQLWSKSLRLPLWAQRWKHVNTITADGRGWPHGERRVLPVYPKRPRWLFENRHIEEGS